jgi:membrane protease YdiL (CAAX protease family)
MWALDHPHVASRPSFFAGTPWRVLGLLGVGVAVAVAAAHSGHLDDAILSRVAMWALHAALISTALGWGAADDPAHPLRALGLGVRPSRAALAAAVGIGGGLAVHLLITASRTLGYPIVVNPPSRVLAALVYDVALNVPGAEAFFRGALFNRAQRRWSFATALVLSTLASVLRYLVDPALPKIPEVLLGAVFYVALIGVANGWLVWWSGSLLPPLLVSLLFFSVYRALRME